MWSKGPFPFKWRWYMASHSRRWRMGASVGRRIKTGYRIDFKLVKPTFWNLSLYGLGNARNISSLTSSNNTRGCCVLFMLLLPALQEPLFIQDTKRLYNAVWARTARSTLFPETLVWSEIFFLAAAKSKTKSILGLMGCCSSDKEKSTVFPSGQAKRIFFSELMSEGITTTILSFTFLAKIGPRIDRTTAGYMAAFSGSKWCIDNGTVLKPLFCCRIFLKAEPADVTACGNGGGVTVVAFWDDVE